MLCQKISSGIHWQGSTENWPSFRDKVFYVIFGESPAFEKVFLHLWGGTESGQYLCFHYISVPMTYITFYFKNVPNDNGFQGNYLSFM